jgi:MFS family permease
MSDSPDRSPPLGAAFFRVLLVQLLSTLADNAFLIVAIARVIELGEAAWLIPILKVSATFFYVALAPFVGPIADAIPKGRVMLLANGFKCCAIGLLLFGLDPVLVIGLAGVGAAVYAPAKYGLVTELVPGSALVRANGYFEAVTVCAVVFGVVLGGFLVSPFMPVLSLGWMVTGADQPSPLTTGVLVVIALHGAATMGSWGLADSHARYAPQPWKLSAMCRAFVTENRMLWRDPLGGMSLAVTTLLWGAGATLQLVVLRWATESLALPLSQASYLQGMSAVGIVVGAALASRWVTMRHAARLLPLGILLGVSIPLLLLVDTVSTAALLLVYVGALAGFFVVPMNALLQLRGCTLLTAGRSVAVQGFNENAGMLLMLLLYAAATAYGVAVPALVIGFGFCVGASMALLWWAKRRHLGAPVPTDSPKIHQEVTE